jgi:hypothetical protein
VTGPVRALESRRQLVSGCRFCRSVAQPRVAHGLSVGCEENRLDDGMESVRNKYQTTGCGVAGQRAREVRWPGRRCCSSSAGSTVARRRFSFQQGGASAHRNRKAAVAQTGCVARRSLALGACSTVALVSACCSRRWVPACIIVVRTSSPHRHHYRDQTGIPAASAFLHFTCQARAAPCCPQRAAWKSLGRCWATWHYARTAPTAKKGRRRRTRQRTTGPSIHSLEAVQT